MPEVRGAEGVRITEMRKKQESNRNYWAASKGQMEWWRQRTFAGLWITQGRENQEYWGTGDSTKRGANNRKYSIHSPSSMSHRECLGRPRVVLETQEDVMCRFDFFWWMMKRWRKAQRHEKVNKWGENIIYWALSKARMVKKKKGTSSRTFTEYVRCEWNE